MGMANLDAGLGTGSLAATEGVAGLFRARYPEMVRLAGLLGADDPEDIAQEAFARLIRKQGSLRNPDAALAYVRASVCNLTRNRHRHLRVVRLRTPTARPEDSSEQAAILREDHREVLAALAALAPPGSGLRLWAFSVPTRYLAVELRRDVITGYDAAGHVVWQQRFASL